MDKITSYFTTEKQPPAMAGGFGVSINDIQFYAVLWVKCGFPAAEKRMLKFVFSCC